MPDYAAGKIYRLWSANCEEVYIGSTTQTLHGRYRGHKCDAKKNKNNSSKIVIASGGAVIELVENFPCESKKELERREGEIIRSTDCCNKCIAGRTDKEWCADNTGYYQQYRLDNAVEIAEYQQQYRITNADHIAEYQQQYQIDNREKIREQKRQYQIDNAVQIREQQRQNHLKRKAKRQILSIAINIT